MEGGKDILIRVIWYKVLRRAITHEGVHDSVNQSYYVPSSCFFLIFFYIPSHLKELSRPQFSAISACSCGSGHATCSTERICSTRRATRVVILAPSCSKTPNKAAVKIHPAPAPTRLMKFPRPQPRRKRVPSLRQVISLTRRDEVV